MQKEPIRVAQIIGKMNAGGVKTVVMEYYTHIDRAQVQFDFIVDDDSLDVDSEEIQKMGGRVFMVPRYQKLIPYLVSLYRLFRQEKFQIVHARINALNVFPLFAAWLARVPVRIAENLTTSHPNEKKTLLKKCLRPFQGVFATHRMACSEHCARWMYGPGYQKSGVKIFKTAYSVEKYGYQPQVREMERARLGVQDCFVVGNIGRLAPQKNQLFLLEIFAALVKEEARARLLLIGDGPLRGELEQRARELGVYEKVQWMGTQKQVWNYYQAMDSFVFPSLYEGLGIVAVQAQNSGLPCVVSDQVPPEADVTGTLRFLPLDAPVQKWTEAILSQRGIERRDQSEKVKEAGYDIDLSAKELANYYRQCLAHK